MDPIAIVGMGCRLPGGVKSPGDLWELIMKREIANTSRVPPSRFDIDAYHHLDNDRPGSFSTPGGYFLDDHPEDFDPTFFKISPIEAMWMDPQQRKLLEVVYEALEDSGSTLEQVSSQVTGCFVASFTSDFQQMTLKEHDFRHSYGTTGIDPGLLGNRVSHIFDLRGPSVLVNTACSSSMYALDSACLAITRGECEGAVVGGANWILTVDQHMNTAKLGVLSPTSTCHSFDESADGYGRAEAVGALYIKRLSAALRDGNPIRAVIRSTATNANGRHSDNGITYPSMQGQASVITTAHKLGNLDPLSTAYVECHGTGTPTGDPIEVRAISMALRNRSERQEPILIGSIKPNIGHSEAASSICTVMKAVLALEKGIIPPTAGVKRLNTTIPWETLNVRVVTEPTPFPPFLPVQRIGVSAFGYGGTNGHAIIESAASFLSEYCGYRRLRELGCASQNGFHNGVADHSHLLLFSAHNKTTLMKNVEALREACHNERLLDLAHTLAARRSEHDCRTFAVCRESSCDLGFDMASENISISTCAARVAFAFTGQGAQWAGMGSHLLQMYPSFLAIIKSLDGVLARLVEPPGWSIESALTQSEYASRIHEPAFAQPLCTAIQVGLVELLRSWNISAVTTIGHSSGEIAAAYAAGLISAQDAITIAYLRGRVVSSPGKQGAMLAVGLGSEQVKEYLAAQEGRLVIACHNSPDSVTISGEAEAIHELKSTLDANSIFARSVRTGGQAYHSHHMTDIACKYLELLRLESKTSEPFAHIREHIPMFSTVTGSSIESKSMNATYWCKNMTNPVLFNQAMQSMLSSDLGIDTVVEIGPHSTFSGPLRQICAKSNRSSVIYLPSLKRNENDHAQLLRLAGQLWARKAPVDTDAVTCVEQGNVDGSVVRKSGKLLVDLPPYQWTYTKRLWAESRYSREHRQSPYPRHDILGRKVLGTSTIEPVWRNVLRHKDLPWLKHHSLGGEAVFPAAGYFAMAIEAVTQANSFLQKPHLIKGYTLKDVTIPSAIVVPDDDNGVETLFSLRPCSQYRASSPGLWHLFTVSSLSHGEWKEHATGKVSLNIRSRGRKPKPLPSLPVRSTYTSWNNKLRTLGFDFGPTFRNSTTIHTNNKLHVATADTLIKQECGLMVNESRYVMHPANIDSCLQTSLVAIHKGNMDDVLCANVLTHFTEVSIWAPHPAQLNNGNASATSWMSHRGNRSFVCHTELVGPDGELLADFSGYRCVPYEAGRLPDAEVSRKDLYSKLHWELDLYHLADSFSASGMGEMTLDRLFGIFLHKNASLRALFFGAEMLGHLPKRHFEASITVAVGTEEEVDRLRAEYATDKGVSVVRVGAPWSLMKESHGLDAFDLVVLPKAADLVELSSVIQPILKPQGHLVALEDPSRVLERPVELRHAFSLRVQDYYATVWRHSEGGVEDGHLEPSTHHHDLVPNTRSALLVYRKGPHSFQVELASILADAGFAVRTSSLADAIPRQQEPIIVLAELESPVFATLTSEELHAVQRLTEGISSIAWVTPGGLLKALRPEYAMAGGWGRVVRNENQLLDLVLVDVDDAPSSKERLAKVLLGVVNEWAARGESCSENEYCISDGAVYVGRLVPDDGINERFATRHQEPERVAVKDAPALKGESRSAKLTFRRDDRIEAPLHAEEVEIKVRSLGLNKEDADIAANSDYFSPFFNHEIAGTVTRVGSSVPPSIAVGDSVFGLSFDTLATVQKTRYDLVQRMAKPEAWEVMSTLPTASTTALYALEDLARVASGDNVVILDDCGAVGLVAVQICAAKGATAIVVTESERTEDLLRSSNLTLAGIVRPTQGDLATTLERLTNDAGIDVVLCSAIMDSWRLEECIRVMAAFGRIIFCGTPSQAFPALAARNASFLSFSIPDLYRYKPCIVKRLLQRSAELYRKGTINPVWPVIPKRPTESTEAIRSISPEMGHGRVALSLSPDSLIEYQEQRKGLRFSDQATYLLVGCLGGLGRSMSSWMIERGAKHLAFLSRSGADSPLAAELVTSLRRSGAHIQVLRADVTSKVEVEAAFATIDPRFPIRGVVNAAVVLRDTFFHNMQATSWHQVLAPKVKGSLVLHETLSRVGGLDFFVMTSSIAATLGAGGQSNYAAANSFLDALAHHRRALGLPGVSLILPAVLDVGYVSENPEIEASIRRRGMSCISEEDMLRAFEVAMTPLNELPCEIDHIIAGLQPMQLAASVKAAKADLTWMMNPRLRTLLAAMSEYSSPKDTATDTSMLVLIESASDDADTVKRMEKYIVERLSRLLMINVEDIEGSTSSLANFGLDSMIGAEFRNWIFREFKIDMPFQQLLASNLTIQKLAVDLFDQISERRQPSLR